MSLFQFYLIFNFSFIIWSSEICSGHIYATVYRVIPSFDLDFSKLKVSRRQYNSMNISDVTLIVSELAGTKNLGYYIPIGIGTPPQTFNMILDTGSSDTAVAGTPHPFLKSYFVSSASSTFRDLGSKLSVKYETGKWSGNLASDNISVQGIHYYNSKAKIKSRNGISVNSQFAVITWSQGFFLPNSNWQGVLGLAYPFLSQSTGGHRTTIFDNIVNVLKIPNMFSIALCGFDKGQLSTSLSGHFIAGGVNESLFEPPMAFIMIRQRWYYEIIISRISVGYKPIILSSCVEYNKEKTILDSGTTDNLLAPDVFDSLVSSIIQHMMPHPFDLPKNSPFWYRKAALCTLASQNKFPAEYFPDIHFDLVINDTSSLKVALSPQNYIQYLGDQTDFFGNLRRCFKFGFGESTSGTILGVSFFEGFYILFDRKNNTIGIAQSKCNSYISSLSRSRIIQISHGQQGLLSCAASRYPSGGIFDSLATSLTMIFCIIFAVILIPGIVLLLYLQCRQTPPQERKAIFDDTLNAQSQPSYNTINRN